MKRLTTTTLAAGLLLAGCASTPPPRAAIAQAELAVTEAEKQGAAQHAPLALRKAQDKLRAARQEADSGSAVPSRRNAEQAEVDALVAGAEARRAEAIATAEELEASILAIEEEIEYDSR